MEIIGLKDVPKKPWKNGGGVSWEIAADEELPPAWRISVALIDRSGPFSDYAGYDRTIVAVDGDPVELSVNGRHVVLEHGVPFDFPGEARVECTVNGSARDFNVMTRRNVLSHDVEMVAIPQRFILDDDELAFVFVVRGNVLVGTERCETCDTVYIDDEEDRIDVTPEKGALACVVRITPL